MNGQMVKDDFENVFLEEEGCDFELVRDNAVVGIVRGLLDDTAIQCKAESDVRVGDALHSKLHNQSFLVEKVSFEIVGNVRTCLIAQVSEA